MSPPFHMPHRFDTSYVSTFDVVVGRQHRHSHGVGHSCAPAVTLAAGSSRCGNTGSPTEQTTWFAPTPRWVGPLDRAGGGELGSSIDILKPG